MERMADERNESSGKLRRTTKGASPGSCSNMEMGAARSLVFLGFTGVFGGGHSDDALVGLEMDSDLPV